MIRSITARAPGDPGVQRGRRGRARDALRWCVRGALRGCAVRVTGAAPRGAQPTLRVDEEHPRCHDRLPFAEALAHLDALVEATPQRDAGSGHEAPVALDDEDVLRLARVDDGVARDGERRGAGPAWKLASP